MLSTASSLFVRFYSLKPDHTGQDDDAVNMRRGIWIIAVSVIFSPVTVRYVIAQLSVGKFSQIFNFFVP